MRVPNWRRLAERLKPYGPVIFQVLPRVVWFVCAIWLLRGGPRAAWEWKFDLPLLSIAWTGLLTGPGKRLSSWVPVLIVAAITLIGVYSRFPSMVDLPNIAIPGTLASLVGFRVPRRGKRSLLLPWIINIVLRCFRAVLSLSAGVSPLLLVVYFESRISYDGQAIRIGAFAAMVLAQFGFDHAGALVQFAMGRCVPYGRSRQSTGYL